MLNLVQHLKAIISIDLVFYMLIFFFVMLIFFTCLKKTSQKKGHASEEFFPAEKPFVKTTRCAALHMGLAVLPKHSAEAVSMLRIDRVELLCVI